MKGNHVSVIMRQLITTENTMKKTSLEITTLSDSAHDKLLSHGAKTSQSG
jgi:hypothetical protein